MGSREKGKKRSVWNDEKDQLLRDAVKACLPLKEEVGGIKDSWWGLVAGHTGLPITPGSARARYQRLRTEDRSVEAGVNGGNGVSDVAREGEWVDAVRASVENMQEQMNDMQAKIDRLVAVWGVEGP